MTFQLTDAQEQTVTVSKVFTVTVKGQQTNMREQLLAKLDAGFASYGLSLIHIFCYLSFISVFSPWFPGVTASR